MKAVRLLFAVILALLAPPTFGDDIPGQQTAKCAGGQLVAPPRSAEAVPTGWLQKSALQCVTLSSENNWKPTSLNISDDTPEHGGGLNACGCHFNRKQGTWHCHQDRGCGCECQPARCP